MANQELVLEILKEIKYPGFSRDIVSFGLVNDVHIEADQIEVKLVFKSDNTTVGTQIEQQVQTALAKRFSTHKVEVQVSYEQPQQKQAAAPGQEATFLTNIKHKIAVASGKGGVGKSTVAVNLAIAMAQKGLKVGLLDADIYGPSIPLMLGIKEQPYYDGNKIHPIEKHGVHWMSLGLLVNNDDAVIWRGALVHRALQQLMTDVQWPDLDVILFDMPPGTGDAQLTLSQSVALSGAVIVSTPQDVALLDAVKGVQMFKKVNVPILGIVENMSFFICPHCSERSEIFSYGGVQRECNRLGVSLLGEIPIDGEIRAGGDSGQPVTVKKYKSPHSKAFESIAETIKKSLSF